MSFTTQHSLGIIYNFPSEYNLIGHELARRNHRIKVVQPQEILFDPEKYESEFDLIYNDLSTPSGFISTPNVANLVSTYSKHFEVSHFQFAQGRIINPSYALDIFSNRTRQLSLFSSLDISFPKTRIVYSVEKLISTLPDLKFPVLVKKNNPFDSTPVLRFDSLTDLLSSVVSDTFPLREDILLIQEYKAPKNNQLFQVDIGNGRFIGARKVHTIKQKDSHVELEVERNSYTPTHDVIHAAEQIARTARIDLGTIEYFVDRGSNQIQFFGVSPFQPSSSGSDTSAIGIVADIFERRLQKIREVQLAL